MMKPYRLKGFTLIELMIVVAIAAILATIAYPSYLAQVAKTRRSEATSWLLIVASQQERYYTRNNQYATVAGLMNTPGQVNIPTENGYYTITVTPAAPNQTYTLTATPAGGWADAACGNFTLTNTGARGVSGDFDNNGSDGDDLAPPIGDGNARDINDIRSCWD